MCHLPGWIKGKDTGGGRRKEKGEEGGRKNKGSIHLDSMIQHLATDHSAYLTDL